jgi:predicted DNA-binding WGR domain protein
MFKVYEWLNREKSRYFTITVQKDGTSNIVLNYNWGGCHSNRGGTKNICVQTQEEANKFISKMMRRRKSRGYELVAPMGYTVAMMR